MSILGPVRNCDQLSPEQREDAWKLAYRTSLDELPDSEVAWERETWRALGAHEVAAIAVDLLSERQRDAFTLPGGADAADLDRLLSRVNVRAVMRLVEDEGLCLIAATRLVFWSGLSEVPR